MEFQKLIDMEAAVKAATLVMDTAISKAKTYPRELLAIKDALVAAIRAIDPVVEKPVPEAKKGWAADCSFCPFSFYYCTGPESDECQYPDQEGDCMNCPVYCPGLRRPDECPKKGVKG